MGFFNDLNKLVGEVQGVRKELNGLKGEVMQSVKAVASEAAGLKDETIKQVQDVRKTVANDIDDKPAT